ncbi:MAG: hypothetical protein DRI71_08425 [Bacteroidetes bacterium]|nr:MAG: hypothetical protein DRI71_08425 [Bacteroidota bacterium]
MVTFTFLNQHSFDMNRNLIIMALIVALSNPLFAQLEYNEETHKVEHKNAIALFVGNTIIAPSGFNLPTIGVEYVREVNYFIGAGLIAEVEIGSHIVLENEEGYMVSEVERKGALLVLPAIFFRLHKGLILSAGYGVEFENHENLGLLKVSLEYELFLKNPRWIVLPTVSWDHTHLFNGFVYGVNFGYVF